MQLRQTLLVACILLCATAYERPRVSSPLAKFSNAWNAPKYNAANTAKNLSYLSPQEKELIYLLNLVRMDPALFAQTVLPKQPVNEQSTYYQSLLKHLKEMKPQPLLLPDSLCWVSAKCHALSSGLEGYDGHDRITEECRKKEYFMGECCHYGSGNPLDFLVSLLIDEGIPSLGHRKICLGGYRKIGVSIQPHSVYATNVVLDFY
jgi:hypothetical protein